MYSATNNLKLDLVLYQITGIDWDIHHKITTQDLQTFLTPLCVIRAVFACAITIGARHVQQHRLATGNICKDNTRTNRTILVTL